MKIVQYKKIAMMLLLSSLPFSVYAIEEEVIVVEQDDESRGNNGLDGLSETQQECPSSGNRSNNNTIDAQSKKGKGLAISRYYMSPEMRKGLAAAEERRANTESARRAVDSSYEEKFLAKYPTADELHNLERLADRGRWFEAGGPGIDTDRLEVLEKLIPHYADKTFEELQQEKKLADIGRILGTEDPAQAKRLAELNRTVGSESPDAIKRLIDLGRKSIDAPENRFKDPKDLLTYYQAQNVRRKLDFEDDTFLQRLNRTDVKVAVALNVGTSMFDLFIKRYGDSILGAIEQRLGFGPSEQEQVMAMQQMMNHIEFQNRRNRAEINEKELKVSILRAVRKKQDLEAEKEELHLDTVKSKKYLWDDIVELTREKIKQGPNFPANKLKELNELKALYKEGQMIDKELQDLKRTSNPGAPIAGMV